MRLYSPLHCTTERRGGVETENGIVIAVWALRKTSLVCLLEHRTSDRSC